MTRMIIENFVHQDDALSFMKFFDKNQNLCYDERSQHSDRNIHLEHIPDKRIKQLLRYYEQKNIFFIDHYFNIKTVPWHEPRLCRWKKGHSMDLHVDQNPDLKDYMDYSSLVYLNDNYKGGELFFRNQDNQEQDFKMKALSCMIFESNAFNSHGVRKILKEKRYTIPSWYRKT